MQLIPGPFTTAPADIRLAPDYYFQPDDLGPYIMRLLKSCPTVFDIKSTMAADLDHLAAAGLYAEPRGVVEDGALLQGEVIVQAGARIEAGAQVVGPALICTGAIVSAGALIRDHTVIGPGCRIGFGAEITRSLLIGHVFMKHPCFIGDSVIGRRVNVGSFCSTTGLRCDRGPVAEPAIEEITVTLGGQRITTGQTKFGAVIGDKVALPAGTVLSPGTLIGPGTVIYPRDHIGGFLPAGSRVR
ncbi:bifunctional UDP-N-acetylglucosamine pyrophosphorylase / Glucosamine-1-phosphate N-acetyltransferase [Streptosporangium canum]|uniref:Bifunctional UDP-N-acetylglucosamine pyrophosphorylase / Glucosamine-1-phosphate N-acetyltransferase n=1 Tax=Streptosporangium canum TaxID=324952 RepID=A0A1I3FCP6_9ACTN|nr:hypothetical protein [Streptosporangium canum]SFI08960.1 bifunctional UDP-N-acetylglucosamine pyrophosphorylase / Glucosamine-1-phosphate N-acetyltransferase [Streptosporangium canum]